MGSICWCKPKIGDVIREEASEPGSPLNYGFWREYRVTGFDPHGWILGLCIRANFFGGLIENFNHRNYIDKILPSGVKRIHDWKTRLTIV